MKLQAERPDAERSSLPSLTAAAQEDLLLEGLVPQLRAEREQLAVLLRRVDRLRRLLSQSHGVVAQLRRDLALAACVEGRDPLTGLPNRRGFELPGGRVLAEHVGGPYKLALLFVDLDGFKGINDRLGHAVGDALLQIVASRLAAGMRRGDLVCRHGGDEFVCLLPNLESEDRALALAAGLLHAVTQPCALGGHHVTVGASIGVAVYPRDGDSLPALMHRADGAMYEAKKRRCGLAMAHLDGLPAGADGERDVVTKARGAVVDRLPPGLFQTTGAWG
jgi:diguanylate cyclase (GGDEF)-like protein